MLEISTSIHRSYKPLVAELVAMRDTLVAGADRLDIEVAGGGAHPFQRWYERQIYDRPRFRHVAGLYGYLAKQFTVFGQHVHIGCENGTQALWLLHQLSTYIPQFIALAAASPYFQGVDTAYDCSRLNSVYAFPLSGRAPFLTDWPAFERFFAKLKALGVVQSMKDFYWDVRPKPEFGTIEVRVCDTPLTVERAAVLAAYIQAICRMLLDRPVAPESEEIYLTYNYNRFQACRFGLEGQVINGATGASRALHQEVLSTLDVCRPFASELESTYALDEIERLVRPAATMPAGSARRTNGAIQWQDCCWSRLTSGVASRYTPNLSTTEAARDCRQADSTIGCSAPALAISEGSVSGSPPTHEVTVPPAPSTTGTIAATSQ